MNKDKQPTVMNMLLRPMLVHQGTMANGMAILSAFLKNATTMKASATSLQVEIVSTHPWNIERSSIRTSR